MTAPPGAQAERTALAWGRTALAVGVGALVGARLAAPAAGAAAYAVVALGGVVAVTLTWTASARYRSARRALAGELGDASSAGLPAALLASSAALTGLLALLYVLAGR